MYEQTRPTRFVIEYRNEIETHAAAWTLVPLPLKDADNITDFFSEAAQGFTVWPITG